MDKDKVYSPDSLRVLRHLGQGSFAECKSVKVKQVAGAGPVLCCKELRSFRTGDTGEVDQFRREMSVLEALNHENIVKFVGRSQSGTRCFMLLEYVEGGSLRKLLLKQMMTTGKPLYSEGTALRWCQQLASVLAYLHSRPRPLIHRDLHPDNIMLTHSNPELADVRLIDFGLHRELDLGDAYADAGEGGVASVTAPEVRRSIDLGIGGRSLRTTGSMVPHRQPEEAVAAVGAHALRRSISAPLTGQTGAFMYMSPEMLQSQQYDTATDVFSMGVNMYEIFSRHLRSVIVCTNQSSPELLEQYAYKVAGGFRPDMPSGIPEAVGLLISRCWAQDPSARPTAAEVLATLNDIISTRPVKASPKQQQQEQQGKEAGPPPLMRSLSRRFSSFNKAVRA